MPTSWTPCPQCGTRGAQLIRYRPATTDYFCESCLTQFVLWSTDVAYGEDAAPMAFGLYSVKAVIV